MEQHITPPAARAAQIAENGHWASMAWMAGQVRVATNSALRPLAVPLSPLVERARDRMHDRMQPIRRLRKSRFARPLTFLAALGPGLIAANAGNDAGGIVTYSAVGAQYGYSLLWAMVIVTVCMAVVQEMCARMGAATGQGLSDLIRERFGVRGAALAMLMLLIANGLITISEFAGIAVASELLGISKYITVPIAAVGVWLLVTRGSYGRVEKVFLAMTLAFFAYPIATILARPNWGSVVHGTLVPTVPHTNVSSYLLLLVGLIGTTITPYMQLYIQSAVAEKGVDMEHYLPERNETYFSALFGDLISATIIIAMGATVFVGSRGVGVQITSAYQAATALVPFLGRYAEVIFAVGLIGASLLAASVLPLVTAFNICESFGFERGVSQSFQSAPIFNGLFTGMLAFGALVALIPGLPLVQLLIVVQVINGILLPLELYFILRLINDPRVMGKYVNGVVNNIIAVGTTVLLSVLSAVMVLSIVLPLVGIPFLQ